MLAIRTGKSERVQGFGRDDNDDDDFEDKKSKKYRLPPRPIFIKVKQACEIMGIGRTKFYDEVSKETIKIKHCGRSTLVLYDSIEQWAEDLKDHEPNK